MSEHTQTECELMDALRNLLSRCNGHLGTKPYSVPEYREGLKALGRAMGRRVDGDKWMDVPTEPQP